MKKCLLSDISLKSNFLGPQAENSSFLFSLFAELLTQHSQWRKSLFPKDGSAISTEDLSNLHYLNAQKKLILLVDKLSTDFQKEIPHFSPRYMGHMFSETSLPGLLGHVTALLYNPNNISMESSRVGLKIEANAIRSLYKMLKWRSGIGHLTSGGTIANLEALLRMRAKLPTNQWANAKLLTSSAAHYSWKKNLKILGFPESAFLEVPLDSKGRLSISYLKKILLNLKDPILGIVTLYGSTERGTIDDIYKVAQLITNHKKHIWHHVDAAYGGFYACVKAKPNSHLEKQTIALQKVDSLTLDPHKLGYVPYGCGAFLCRQRKKYFYSDIKAPYIQFQSAQEAGVQSVEGSRPATGAAATWLTAKSLGFHDKGLGRVLEKQLQAKTSFQKILSHNVDGLLFTEGLDLNILCWTVLPDSKKLSRSNKWVDLIFKLLPLQNPPYFVSKTSLPLEKHPWLMQQLLKAGMILDSESCHLVRMTLMNPFLITKETQTQFTREFSNILDSISKSNTIK
ncbi:MAG: pyridoxal-dependent decarboxylase [Pseudobdellovibrio sp.]